MYYNTLQIHRQQTEEERKPLLFTEYSYYGNELIGGGAY